MSTVSPIRLQNSWESRFAEARQLAKNYNDEAISSFEKLIGRLQRMPEKQRKANDELLHRILFTSYLELAYYQIKRGLYSDAIEQLTQMYAFLEFSEQSIGWLRVARLHVLANNADAGLAIMDRFLADDDNHHIGLWLQKINMLLSMNKLDEVRSLLDEVEEKFFDEDQNYIESDRQVAEDDDEEDDDEGDDDEDSDPVTYAYIANARARLEAEVGNADESVHWVKEAFRHSQSDRENPEYAYINLMEKGFHQQALELADSRIQENPKDQFWAALAHYRLGQIEQAEKMWQEILEVATAEQDEAPSPLGFIETILLFLYTGDEEGRVLSGLLSTIQESEDEIEWPLYFFTGLAWGARKNSENTRVNFELARNEHRLDMYKDNLSYALYLYCQDLFNEETLADVREYFDAS
ncbi:MAG: hypothetical protein AAF639_07900 [Chloroflexota bacterium]